MKKIYTAEENIQILISLLKEHNIKKVVVNPGTSNISFVASIQSDDYFELYSCVDERSAAYMACGLSEESGEPVVLTCTGATASRNYMSALTEAFYNKIPIIAITASQHFGRIGQNVPQVIDRSSQLKDIVKKSINLRIVNSDEDRWDSNLKINDVLLECRRNGCGPVHINMETIYSNNFIVGEVPKQKKINRYTVEDNLPKIENKNNIAIFIGNHNIFDDKLTKSIETFCEKYNSVVLCDQTSNYNGKYKILGNLLSGTGNSKYNSFDLMIDIGNISGSYMSKFYKEVWRVNEDGEIRDTYKKLTKIFSMSELHFFDEYNKMSTNKNTSNYDSMFLEDARLRKMLYNIELPFSNPYIARVMTKKISDDSIIHLGILNTLRSWNYFETNKNVKFYSNTGGFGIDGIMSTAIGTSLATSKNVYCCIGDLAFFYDLNSIGNRHIKNNLRILLVNNGCGVEFHLSINRAVKISKENELSLEYIAADKQFGNQSRKLVKHMAEDLGFEYLSAENAKEFNNNIDEFTKEHSDKPIIFEVFTTPEDESSAQEIIQNLDNSLEKTTKNKIKKVLGEKGVRIAKKILGK